MTCFPLDIAQTICYANVIKMQLRINRAAGTPESQLKNDRHLGLLEVLSNLVK